MQRTLTFGLLVAFSCTSLIAQINLQISGAPASPAGQRGHLGVPAGRRPLIGITGAPEHRMTHYRGYGRDAFFYGGWPYSSGEYVDPTPREILVQQPVASAAPSTPVKQEPVPGAALLELHGDKWVQVSSFTMGASSGEPQKPSGSVAKPLQLPPALIVYRDGRTEELTSYSIIGDTMYAKADYWSSGAWTRKILLADVDLPATVKRNQDRGISFQLPSGPNEVILRP